MIEFLEQYWYAVVGVIIGVFAVRRIAADLKAERNDSTPLKMAASLRTPVIAFLGGGLVGAWIAPYLEEEALLATIFGLVFAAIVLGWVVMYTTSPDHVVEWIKNRGGVGWPRGMGRPVAESAALPILFLISGVIGGICLRILFLAWA